MKALHTMCGSASFALPSRWMKLDDYVDVQWVKAVVSYDGWLTARQTLTQLSSLLIE